MLMIYVILNMIYLHLRISQGGNIDITIKQYLIPLFLYYEYHSLIILHNFVYVYEYNNLTI